MNITITRLISLVIIIIILILIFVIFLRTIINKHIPGKPIENLNVTSDLGKKVLSR